jgi:hypothetical protein
MLSGDSGNEVSFTTPTSGFFPSVTVKKEGSAPELHLDRPFCPSVLGPWEH